MIWKFQKAKDIKPKKFLIDWSKFGKNAKVRFLPEGPYDSIMWVERYKNETTSK